MALRALVFSSDGSTTSALCHILTDLGIEAEICSEMLVAVERITGQAYSALLVDWDQQAEAIFLVKQLRELKLGAQALTLALVQNDQDLPQALQAGANSVIRKPIDARQAHDTLSTAKQLILARQVEPRVLESRIAPPPTIEEEIAESAVNPDAVTPEAISHKEGGFAIDDSGNDQFEEPKTKRGFLQQTAPRSAVEAEQQMAGAEAEAAAEPPPRPRPAPDPAARDRALIILGYGPKADPKSSGRSPEQEKSGDLETISAIPTPAQRPAPPRDLNQEFSALPEGEEEPKSASSSAGSRLAFFAVALACGVAVVLWVFAPGHPYSASLRKLLHPEQAATRPIIPVQSTTLRSVSHAALEPKPEQTVQPDPDLTESEDAATSNIQIIENKPIPIAGAQQPLTSDAPPDAQPVQTPPPASSTEPPPAPAGSATAIPAPLPADSTTSASHPQVQSATATQVQPPARPAASVGVTQTPQNISPDGPMSSPAVIIPDSLKKAPPAGSINSVEPPTIPEETSRSMLLKQVEPEYPPIAIPQKLEGTVILQAFVGQDGSVRDLKLVRGYFLLGRAAFDAVRQWRFKPYTQNGKPSEFQTYITISFKLPN